MLENELSKRDLETLAIFKALSGSLRFHILYLLRLHPEGLIVSDIAEILNGSISRISHQLGILKKCNLVTATGLDHKVSYRLNDKRIKKLLSLVCDDRNA